MLIVKRNKRFGTILLVLMLAVVFLPVKVFAEPWDPYAQYLPSETPIVHRHLRGVWISTVINLDWPSTDTRNLVDEGERIEKSKEELIAMLDRAVEMNMNAVFFQVSPEGDALYKSNIVPWSRYLTGTFGKDPGFDPLAFAIEEAHKRNLELHAWLNPYRVSMNINPDTIKSLNIEKSVFKENRQWVKTSMDRFVVDPGIPEAREWVIRRVMEVVNNYDVDGIHFDDYFYYEKFVGELKDQDTFKQYNKGQFSNIGDWRRNNTYLLVKELSHKIWETKSWVKFGISPAGVWGNKKDGHIDGSNTSAGLPNYDRCFADTKKWVEEELLDYIAPQVYFSFGNTRAPYGEIATWWADVCREKNVHLYMGQALYKVNEDSDAYFKGDNAVLEFARQMRMNMLQPEIMGSILFRFKNLNNENKQQVVNAIKADYWSEKALVPIMPWKGGQAPEIPTAGNLEVLYGGVRLSWEDEDQNTAYYTIYQIDKEEGAALDLSNLKLLDTLRKKEGAAQEYFALQRPYSDDTLYLIKAVDRLHHESQGLIIGEKQLEEEAVEE
ncbi:MAG: family 10 glycosylhydrolase [Thermotaleaceae bacterium]